MGDSSGRIGGARAVAVHGRRARRERVECCAPALRAPRSANAAGRGPRSGGRGLAGEGALQAWSAAGPGRAEPGSGPSAGGAREDAGESPDGPRRQGLGP